MHLYKVVTVPPRRQYTDGWYFYSTTIESALFWAHGLFGDKARYFINEYKIPNSTPGLYNQESYRINPEYDLLRKRQRDNDRWAGGDGTNTLMPIGQMPMMSITGQIAIPDDYGPFEYSQVAYYDGNKLIMKKAASQAKAIAQQEFAKVAHMLDAINTVLTYQLPMHMRSYVSEREAGDIDRHTFKTVNTYADIVVEYMEEAVMSIDAVLSNDSLTQNFVLFLKNLKAYITQTLSDVNTVLIELLDAIDKSGFVDFEGTKGRLGSVAEKLKIATRMMKQVNFVTGEEV